MYVEFLKMQFFVNEIQLTFNTYSFRPNMTTAHDFQNYRSTSWRRRNPERPLQVQW